MVNALLLVAVLFSLYKSFSQLFKRQEHKKNYISFENIAFLFLLYVNILVGFGLVYAIFELKGTKILLESGQQLSGSFLDILSSSFYFSAITLLSVGYGDISPVGIGRSISILEALIGYIIPAAFVVRSMVDYEKTP